MTVAGLVIRRQHPAANAIFMTLEDEYGRIPLIVWLGVWRKFNSALKSPIIVASGRVSRREGTLNVAVEEARTLQALDYVPKARDFK